MMMQSGKNQLHDTANTPRAERREAVPLHELAHSCCSNGACRSVPYWPVDYPQDGLLQLSGEAATDIHVDLIGFSRMGVSVMMAAEHPIHQGEKGLLITQAHGGGCSYHPVTCCWHRLDPGDHHRQCAGLRYEDDLPG